MIAANLPIRTSSLCLTLLAVLAPTAGAQSNPALDDAAIQDIVRRSYQYVAMYNVNNKFAASQGGWNTVVADTALKDHTLQSIARPNNDTLYISCLLDLRGEPIVLEMPAFDSKYVSLMVTGYDHYVNIPLSTRLGDFAAPTRMLIHSARTAGYDGKEVPGVDKTFEATGDFVSAVLRVMPHANDPTRFERILSQMRKVKAVTLSEHQGARPRPAEDTQMPRAGKTDADVFGDNLLEVMQFVFNHTTFDADNELDTALLAAYAPLGVVPGRAFAADRVAKIDGRKFRAAAERLAAAELAAALDGTAQDRLMSLFRPKGQITLASLVTQSVIGPIGMPAAEAIYPPIGTATGEPMNAMSDYVLHIAKADLPPARAFWSFTLYDNKTGFFIPNDRKKYSVGENAGMRLNDEGGIDIYVAATRPDGAPLENWLPINRQDQEIGLILRIYVPDLDRLKTWKAPTAAPFVGQ